MNSHRTGATGAIENETEIKTRKQKREEKKQKPLKSLGPWEVGDGGIRIEVPSSCAGGAPATSFHYYSKRCPHKAG